MSFNNLDSIREPSLGLLNRQFCKAVVLALHEQALVLLNFLKVKCEKLSFMKAWEKNCRSKLLCLVPKTVFTCSKGLVRDWNLRGWSGEEVIIFQEQDQL